MPAQLRPIAQLRKVVYNILKTEKDLQQKNTPEPTEKQKREWATTYMKTNVK